MIRSHRLLRAAAGLLACLAAPVSAQPAASQAGAWREYGLLYPESQPASDLSIRAFTFPNAIVGADPYHPGDAEGDPVGSLVEFDPSRIWLAPDSSARRTGVRIAETSDTLWVVTRSGDLYRKRFGAIAWEKVPAPKAADVGANAKGDVWIIGLEPANEHGGRMYFRSAGTSLDSEWQRTDGVAMRLDVTPEGFAVAVTRSGAVFMPTSVRSWTQVNGIAKDVAVAGDGMTYVIGANDGLFRWEGNGWKERPGRFKAVAAGGRGAVWALGVNGKAYRFVGGSW